MGPRHPGGDPGRGRGQGEGPQQVGRRVFVTLDRPEVLNAQNETFLRELLDVTTGLVDRDDFDAVAIRSSCDHWGSGLDLKAVAAGWRLTAASSEWWETALHHLETIKQLVVALGKQAYYTQVDLDQPKAYAYAKEVMSMNSMAADAQEGISAFLQKRQACWTGK